MIFLVASLVALLSVHVAMAAQVELPVVFSDELAYLAHARLFAGAGQPMDFRDGSAYFSFGYSMLIAPLFRWFDPPRVYTAVAMFNSVALTSLCLGLYLFCRRCLARSRACSITVATLTSLYPSYVLQSSLAWTESVVIPLFVLLVLAWHRHERKRSTGSALTAALLATALYVIHPRGLPLLALVMGALSWQAWRRRLALDALALVTVVVMAMVGAAAWIDHRLMAIEWGGTGGKPLPLLLASLTTPRGLWHDLLGVVGECWYLAVASGGLAVIGALALVRRARGDDAFSHSARFILAASVLLLAATVLNMEYALRVEGLTNLDYLVCGRHNETFVSLFIVSGMVEVYGRAPSLRRDAVIAAATLVALGVILRLGRGDALMTTHVVGTGIFGILPAVMRWGGVDVVRVTALALGVLALVALTARRAPLVGLAVVAATFAVVTAGGWSFLAREQRNMAGRSTLPARFVAFHGPAEVGYDMAAVDWPRYWTYQFLLPRVRFIRFDSRRAPPPPVDAVIAARDWRGAESAGANFVVAEEGSDQALWALPQWSAQPRVRVEPFTTVFGVAPIAGVRESGFYPPERAGATPIRWTDGRARLTIPIAAGVVPRALEIALSSTGPGTRLRIEANGVVLRDEHAPPGGWTAALPLDAVPLRGALDLSLRSEPFSPSAIAPAMGTGDSRKLGVQVRAIRLLR